MAVVAWANKTNKGAEASLVEVEINNKEAVVSLVVVATNNKVEAVASLEEVATPEVVECSEE